MLEPRPARREPRVLALARSRKRLGFAVVDPYEVLALGPLPSRATLTSLVRRLRPTVILVATDHRDGLRELRHLERLARLRGIPFLRPVAAVLAHVLAASPRLDEATRSYPELGWRSTRGALRAVRLALGAIRALPIPSRRYLCSKNLSSRHDPRGARRPSGRSAATSS